MIESVDQIAQMDLVYAGAVMTIIGAAGEDADAGLPGVGDNRREIFHKRVRVSADGLNLVPAASLSKVHYINSSRWNTRGWTFQERSLFRRALTFSPKQVYCICERSV
jgi:hypothetical protein